jgi:type II secretion system protein C
MVRYLGWLATTMLFVLCCFLVADTANAIIAALLAQPAPAHSPMELDAAASESSWDERQVIVRRNLFHSSVLTPKSPEPEPEPIADVLEEPTLPLKLWGTIASSNPDLAWASVEELDSQPKGSKAVRVGDSIKTARVLAIERRRIVLLEKGARRSLSLDDDEVSEPGRSIRKSPSSARSARSSSRTRRSTPSSSSRSRRSARKSTVDRVKQLAKDRFEVDPDDVEEALNNPASLYTQARILPKLGDDGAFMGIEISAIQEGSVFEQVGIEDGDVITAIGGEALDNVEQTGGLVSALTEGESVPLTIQSPDGETSTKQFQFPPQ